MIISSIFVTSWWRRPSLFLTTLHPFFVKLSNFSYILINKFRYVGMASFFVRPYRKLQHSERAKKKFKINYGISKWIFSPRRRDVAMDSVFFIFYSFFSINRVFFSAWIIFEWFFIWSSSRALSEEGSWSISDRFCCCCCCFSSVLKCFYSDVHFAVVRVRTKITMYSFDIY